MRFRIGIVVFSLAAAGSGGLPADDQPAVAVLIERLDDDAFLVRQQAVAELTKIGEQALPLLVAATKDASAERRARATEVLRSIQSRILMRGFGELGKLPDKDIDVERGMVLIAQILDPEVTREAVAAQLDEVAAAVRAAVPGGAEPKSLAGAEAVATITGVLRDKYRLRGDTETYDHPDNSSIHRAFEQGDGLPILLAEIAVAVGKRLEVPLVGIAVPGRYMFKYDGSRAPAGTPKTDIIIDAFEDWKVTAPEQIAPRWRLGPQADLEPSEPRATIERMLSNLSADFIQVGDRQRAQAVVEYRTALGGTGLR